ncbi:hypothetical protein TH61_08500 [Rufibacter sp. DG15C]|nr:hypothetical protein TH61_08500 [Rufibacter sp. DG15C]
MKLISFYCNSKRFLLYINMGNTFIESNIQAIERAARNRDVLKEIALSNFEIKRRELVAKLEDKESLYEQLEVVQSELIATKAIIELPLSQEYIRFGLNEVTEMHLQQLREYYLNVSEEIEKLKILSAYKTFLGMSREQGIKHLETIVGMGADAHAEELQLLMMNVWTWKYYHGCLIEARKWLGDQILAQKDSGSENPILENTKGIESNGNLLSSPNSKKQYTTMQQALAISLLDKFTKINRSQDKKSLTAFIGALTNSSEGETGKKVSQITNSNYEPHKTPKQNLIDYQAIEPLFEALEQRNISEFIAQKINQLQKMNNK